MLFTYYEQIFHRDYLLHFVFGLSLPFLVLVVFVGLFHKIIQIEPLRFENSLLIEKLIFGLAAYIKQNKLRRILDWPIFLTYEHQVVVNEHEADKSTIESL